MTAEFTAKAAKAMPYGSPVKRNKAGRLLPARIELNWDGKPVAGADDDLPAMLGVLKRRLGAHSASHCSAGETVTVKTGGGIMALVAERPVWLHLRDGRPAETN